MLLIEGWLKLGTGEFAKMKDAAQAVVAATLAEDGCLVVSLILDPPQFREGIRRLVARAR